MGYSEAARAGVDANGRTWKRTLHDVRDAIADISDAVRRESRDDIVSGLRRIGKEFRSVMKENNASFDELEALEWILEEDPAYEIGRGELKIWVEEFDANMARLYDWADYNRVWLAPRSVEPPAPASAPEDDIPAP